MKYKSELEPVLILQEKYIKEKEREIAKIVAARKKVQEKIEKEEMRSQTLWNTLEEGKAVDSAFFINIFDHGELLQLRENLKKWDENLKERRIEYQKLIKKRDIIIELDKKKEKEFKRMVEKREQRKVEEIRSFLVSKNKEGEMNDY